MSKPREYVTVSAPASTANLGPAFDVMGVALEQPADRITVRRRSEPGIVISSISGEGKGLPLDTEQNTAGMAALTALKRLGITDEGVELEIFKGIPFGGGLGSSAASAAGAAWAVNLLFGGPCTKEEMIEAAISGEAVASQAWHADNVAPSLLGGFILIRSYEPLDIIRLEGLPEMWLTLVSPHFRLNTREARRVIPATIPLAEAVSNWGNTTALGYAIATGNLELFARAVCDHVVEPRRASLIPGFFKVKASALAAGALACSISGAGPTLFAVSADKPTAEEAGVAMVRAFDKAGLDSTVFVSRPNQEGVKEILHG